MKVKCIATICYGERSLIKIDYSASGILKLDAIYQVYGVSLWMMKVHYLLIPKEVDWPDWYEAELFDVSDELLYMETYYKYFGVGDVRGVNALWGYKEMVLDFDHYENLIEHDGEAMKIFLKRKQEMDEFG